MDDQNKKKSSLENHKKPDRDPKDVTGVRPPNQQQRDNDPGNQSKNPGQGDTSRPKHKIATP
jgi:hypothetical protein